MVTFNTQVVTPGAEINKPDVAPAEEANALAELEAHKAPPGVSYTGHMHTIEPLSKQSAAKAAAAGTPQTPDPTSTPAASQAQPPAVAAPQPQNSAPTAQQAQDATQTTTIPAQQPQSAAPQPAAAQNANVPVTPKDQTAILQLASNDDLNVATIAREAGRNNPVNEVVIKMH